SQARYPWTIELIGCGLAIGNLVYLYYKQMFKRVRPSALCPGLIPPFGPPAHPAFPSGHSTLGHLIPLLLLEIPALRERFGIVDPEKNDGQPGKAVDPHLSFPEVTMSIGSPAKVTWKHNKLRDGDPIVFQTNGHLPEPIRAGRIYYVRKRRGDSFEIA